MKRFVPLLWIIETGILCVTISSHGQAQSSPDQALFAGIRNHDSVACSRALQHGANPNAINTEGTTALIAAAEQCDTAIVSLLLKHKADIHARETKYSHNSPLIAAVNLRSRHARAGRKATVKLLLAHGADVNVANFGGYHALNLIIQYDLVKMLVEHGAAVNAADRNGITPLMLAAGASRIQTVKLLLAKGARANAVDVHSESVLCWAVSGGNVDIVRLLITRGADVHYHGSATPLQLAIYARHPEIVQILKRAGAKE